MASAQFGMKLAQIPKIYTMANAAQANKEQAVNSEQKKDQSKGNKMKRKTNTKKKKKEGGEGEEERRKQKAAEHKLKSHTNQIAWVCGEFI